MTSLATPGNTPEIGMPPDLNLGKASLKSAIRPWILSGFLIISTVFVGLGLWASNAPIAKAVVASGSVKVDQNRKRVQHPEGGTVSEILVRDGDLLHAGEVVVRLDATSAKASLGIVRANHDAELARLARLTSERDGNTAIEFPTHLTDRNGEDAVAKLLAVQTQLFETRRTGLTGNVEIFNRQIIQLKEKRKGIKAQVSALRLQTALIKKELKNLNQLFDKGYVGNSKILALKKDAARTKGERGELISEAAETLNAISEKEQQILQISYDFNQRVADGLRESQTKILDLQERLNAANHVLNHIEIRSPVDGVVVSLSVFSKGEVIQPGDVILEVVPRNESLIVEAKVRLTDIDNLTIGQEADILFTAFKSSPVVLGKVNYISADAFEDKNTGMGYFKVKVTVSPEELNKLGDQKLQPGMPADVIIKLGERTVLQYLYQPISDALAKAWTEE